MGAVPTIIALGGVVLSERHGTGVASDRNKVTAVPSVLVGLEWHAYPCQRRRAWLRLTSRRSSQGSGWWRGHASLVRCVAKSIEGVVAGPRLSAWPNFLGSVGPRLFGLLLADVSWAARPAN